MRPFDSSLATVKYRAVVRGEQIHGFYYFHIRGPLSPPRPLSGCLISMTMSTTYYSDKKLGTISSPKACTSDGKILVPKLSTGRHKKQKKIYNVEISAEEDRHIGINTY